MRNNKHGLLLTVSTFKIFNMKNNIQIVAAYLCIALFMMGCSNNPAQPVYNNPVVPDAIKVLPNESLKFTAKAKGVQIYECDTIAPDQYGWVFKAPEAELFDEKGAKIGLHFKSTGPTWESADGSRVVGKKLKEVEAPVADAIPWLLLEGSSNFSWVTKIQRVDTRGGKAPSEACDQKTVGKQIRVPYTATYYFYVAN